VLKPVCMGGYMCVYALFTRHTFVSYTLVMNVSDTRDIYVLFVYHPFIRDMYLSYTDGMYVSFTVIWMCHTRG